MKIEVNQYGKNIFNVSVDDFNILEGTPIFIGRSSVCHIRLDDQKLSREHAKIYYSDSCLFVESLSEYQKIEVNGNEIQKIELSLQDKITIGEFVLKIVDWDYQNNRRKSTASSIDSQAADDDVTVLLKNDDLTSSIKDATEIIDNDDLAIEENFDDVSSKLEEIEDNFNEINSIEPEEESSFNDSDFSNEDFSDESFEQDNSEFGETDEDSTRVFKSFANFSLKLTGANAPFDRYIIDTSEVYIGRNPEKCQIALVDSEVSSIHALIKKSLINITIEDKDSSNGTLVNGERINQCELKVGDIIQIGSTKMEVELRSELIENEQDILMPVDEDQFVEVEEIVEQEVDFANSDAFSEGTSPEKGLKGIWKDPTKRKKLIYGLVIIVGLYVFLDDEPAPTVEKDKKTVEVKTTDQNKNIETTVKKHSPETLERLEENYALALAKYEAAEYYEAKEYLDIVYNIDSEYKDTKTLLELVKQGYEEILRLKAQEAAEKERKERQLKVKKIMVKVLDAVKDRNVNLAESLFAEVLEIDPENVDIPQLKIEIDAYKEEQKQIELEKNRKIALRKSMVDALAPGKSLFIKQKWYEAIAALEKFNQKEGMDEDLVEEASNMLKESKSNLNSIVAPLLGKARSFKEGQDYKRAYEAYGDILKNDPVHEESLNERDSILEKLNNNSMKIYREALISESLSLFSEAKEKFQQVQQVSPINSEYYIKATEKLKQYLD